MSEKAFADRRWTRKEYAELIELGVLGHGDPVELIEGRMLVAEPQNNPHAIAIELVVDALRAVFGRGWRIRVQLPLGLDPDSEPEPDVVVLRGVPRDSGDHPSTAELVVEIADSSLRYDRLIKGRVFARAGIAEYWIVNLVTRTVEVYRQPRAGRHPRYTTTVVARPGESIAPLARPEARVAVDDLLP